jgi:hypothetical protein
LSRGGFVEEGFSIEMSNALRFLLVTVLLGFADAA